MLLLLDQQIAACTAAAGPLLEASMASKGDQSVGVTIAELQQSMKLQSRPHSQESPGRLTPHPH